jgi:hypothetical protein
VFEAETSRSRLRSNQSLVFARDERVLGAIQLNRIPL